MANFITVELADYLKEVSWNKIGDKIILFTCNSWLHYACQSLEEKDAKIWRDCSLGYICIQCRTHDDTSFDFLMALERLKKSGKQGKKKLTRAAEREKIFLQNLPFGTDLHMDFTNHDQDPVANFIALNYHSTNMAALATTGNGDCLFNAFSI